MAEETTVKFKLRYIFAGLAVLLFVLSIFTYNIKTRCKSNE